MVLLVLLPRAAPLWTSDKRLGMAVTFWARVKNGCDDVSKCKMERSDWRKAKSSHLGFLDVEPKFGLKFALRIQKSENLV